MPQLQNRSPAMHHNENVEKKREQ